MSMYPTLVVNDQVAVEKFSRFLAPPARGDLIVFSPPSAYLRARGAQLAASAPARQGGPPTAAQQPTRPNALVK